MLNVLGIAYSITQQQLERWRKYRNALSRDCRYMLWLLTPIHGRKRERISQPLVFVLFDGLNVRACHVVDLVWLRFFFCFARSSKYRTFEIIYICILFYYNRTMCASTIRWKYNYYFNTLHSTCRCCCCCWWWWRRFLFSFLLSSLLWTESPSV